MLAAVRGWIDRRRDDSTGSSGHREFELAGMRGVKLGALVVFAVYERPLLRKGAQLARERGAPRVVMVGQRESA